VIRAATLAVGLLLLTAAPAAAPALKATFKVLAFTKTAGYRHDSIPAAIAAVEQLGAQNGFAVDATEDAGAFTDANLAQYAAVVFLLTTGDVLDDTQQAAFQRYIEAGHGFVGVHSAADTEYDWPWYGSLLGTYFNNHPAIQQATLTVEDSSHPSTSSLPRKWTRTDEWYNFRTDPRPSVHVLLTIDETSYDPGDGAMGSDHPVAWWHNYDGGRAWYTSGGHTIDSWSEPLFLAHVLGGIEWAANATSAGVPVSPPRIVSLATTVRTHRIAVTVVHGSCGCVATLRVALGGRAVTKTVPVGKTTTRAATTVPSAGRWRLTFTLTDRTSGKRAAAGRWVTVR
jgi:cytochrome c